MRISCLFVVISLLSLSCLAQEWADFKGRFTFEGKIPERKELKVLYDKESLPADHKVLDESLIVDEKTKGIANILIWVIPDPKAPDAKMPIHPSYTMSLPKEHLIRIKNFAYTPHASIMRTKDDLALLNDDPVGHNCLINFPRNAQSGRAAFHNGRPDILKHVKEERVPVSINCAVHPHETAYLLVRDNPYFAVTNEKGEFEIKQLPLGKWRFKIWQEKCGWIKEATLGGKKTTWTKGELEVEIPKEGRDLGEVVIAGELFSDKKIAAPPAK